MHILYVDESGVEELSTGTSHFVLLSLMVPAEQWKPLDKTLDAVKDRFGLSGIEVHTGWMCRRYCEQDTVFDFDALDRAARRRAAETEIRRRAGAIGVGGDAAKAKRYRREARQIHPYLHLTWSERRQCLLELAKALSGRADLRLFGEAVCKSDFKVYRDLSLYESAFEQVLTRFQASLANMGGVGIVVHDNNSKVAARLTSLARKFHQEGTFYRKIANIVETPLFVDSSLTGMIQMADLCAYALRRFIENGDTPLWSAVEGLVDRSRGRSVGLRHFTGSRPCTCPLCLAHGRS